MSAVNQDFSLATVKGKPFSFQERLKEIGMFFQGAGPVHQTMRRLTQELTQAGIIYAVVGGMAVNAHRHERTTKDVDILLTAEGFAEFRHRFVPRTFDQHAARPKRFVDRANGVTFDILVTGFFPGSGQPGPIAYPDPADVGETIGEIRVVDLRNLIQLKLAARRHQDFADVVNLINVHDLNETFLNQLHTSVHQDFLECLEEKRRNDTYEARQDAQMEELLRDEKCDKDVEPS